METKLLFHFPGWFANLISGMHIIQNFEQGKHCTRRSSFRALALSRIVFGFQFNFY